MTRKQRAKEVREILALDTDELVKRATVQPRSKVQSVDFGCDAELILDEEFRR